MLELSGGSTEQGRQILQLRYDGHALGGEHAAALQLPVLVLLQQHRPNQAGNPGVVGEDADEIGCGGLFLCTRSGVVMQQRSLPPLIADQLASTGITIVDNRLKDPAAVMASRHRGDGRSRPAPENPIHPALVAAG